MDNLQVFSTTIQLGMLALKSKASRPQLLWIAVGMILLHGSTTTHAKPLPTPTPRRAILNITVTPSEAVLQDGRDVIIQCTVFAQTTPELSNYPPIITFSRKFNHHTTMPLSSGNLGIEIRPAHLTPSELEGVDYKNGEILTSKLLIISKDAWQTFSVGEHELYCHGTLTMGSAPVRSSSRFTVRKPSPRRGDGSHRHHNNRRMAPHLNGRDKSSDLRLFE